MNQSNAVETNIIHTGDASDVLKEMPAKSVHCVICSPPYYGLRDYGVDGQLGMEKTLDEYIENIVAVGEEIDRVLRDDGVWWLNLGDSYAQTGSAQPEGSHKESINSPDPRGKKFGRKNKMLVPYRVAIGLQENGWIIRNDAIWKKENPMPHSTKDRLNTTTERFFLLAKESQYYFDLDAIREPYTSTVGDTDNTTNTDSDNLHHCGKNPGDVFEVSTKPFSDAHFAVYPPELLEKPMQSSCPSKVCADCGTPYERDKTEPEQEYERGNEEWRAEANISNPQRDNDGNWGYEAEFHGWMQICDCATDETESGIVLDPFIGAGTTALVAREHQRQFIGIELNPEYADMARSRVGLSVHNPESRRMDAQTGFDQFAE